jgi:hypothetical protein
MDAGKKQFNATAEGQQAMCAEAGTRSTAFMMAAFLRKRGIPTYDDGMIATANPSLLAAIKDELLADYNQAVGT